MKLERPTKKRLFHQFVLTVFTFAKMQRIVLIITVLTLITRLLKLLLMVKLMKVMINVARTSLRLFVKFHGMNF